MHPNPGNPGDEQPGQATPGLAWRDSPHFQTVPLGQAYSGKAAGNISRWTVHPRNWYIAL